MRALPADSEEYFGETAVGNMAFPVAAGAGVVAGAAVRLAVVAAGCDAAGLAGAAAGVAAAGVADASVPHSALRKSFHFLPLRVPAVCAALYLALHSCIVSACAEVALNVIAPNSAPAQTVR